MTNQQLSAGSTSSSLLRLVRRQDQDAWRRLSDIYGPVIYKWCRRAGLQAADAGDVTQEVFRAVMSGIASLRHEQPTDSFRGWLWGITRYKIQDVLRSPGRELTRGGGDTAHDVVQNLPDTYGAALADLSDPPNDRDERVGVIQRTLDQLRPSFDDHIWKAFWQLTLGERTAAEIGAELGMTAEAVRQAKFRVLKRLRRELDGLLD